MLCINSTIGLIDIATKGFDNSFESEEAFLNGDLNSTVQISAHYSYVLDIVNSNEGLQIRSMNGRPIQGARLNLRFVAVSEPTNDFTLCAKSASQSNWTVSLIPLGIELNTKKNTLGLGDKTRSRS